MKKQQLANSNKKPSPYNFLAYNSVKPSHKKTIDSNFLEWFIGFSEGDGSFGSKEGYPTFVINQADLKVLYKIRTTLGFGQVTTFDQNGRTYGRFTVSNQKNVFRLITIFNGNIHLKKVHHRFEKWVTLFNNTYKQKNNYCVLPQLSPDLVSLETAWLSGFFDAEGCVYAGYSDDLKMTNGVRLRLKATIDQQFELPVLNQIQKLFLVKTITIRNKEKEYNRVEMSTVDHFGLVIKYLDTFKLKTRKEQAYAIWKPMVVRFINKKHLTLSKEEIIAKTQKVKDFNQAFKNEKSVLTLLKEKDLLNLLTEENLKSINKDIVQPE